jgi:hypothetical protein
MTDDEMEELRERLHEGMKEKIESYDWDAAWEKYLEGQ